MANDGMRRFRATLRREAQAINERNRVPGDRYYKEPPAVATGHNERWIDCTILVSATENRGSFGSKVISRETFRLCAKTEFEASRLAGSNVPSRGFPGETGAITVSTQLITALPVFWVDIEAAREVGV